MLAACSTVVTGISADYSSAIAPGHRPSCEYKQVKFVRRQSAPVRMNRKQYGGSLTTCLTKS